jgi:hypothetical protein
MIFGYDPRRISLTSKVTLDLPLVDSPSRLLVVAVIHNACRASLVQTRLPVGLSAIVSKCRR